MFHLVLKPVPARETRGLKEEKRRAREGGLGRSSFPGPLSFPRSRSVAKWAGLVAFPGCTFLWSIALSW